MCCALPKTVYVLGGYHVWGGKTREVVALNNQWGASRCGKGSLKADNLSSGKLSKTLQHKSVPAAEGQQITKLPLDAPNECVSLNKLPNHVIEFTRILACSG